MTTSILKSRIHLILSCFLFSLEVSSQPHTPPPSPISKLPIVKPNRENIPFKTILSVDGGGVRGAIPLSILVVVEEKIKSSMVENAELLVSNGVLRESDAQLVQLGSHEFTIQLADFFDIVAGVSAGSIVTTYFATRGETVPKDYSAPRGSAASGLELFTEYASQIFQPNFFRQGLTSALYPADGIDSALKEIFGEDTLLSSIENVTYLATSFELENSRSISFFNDDVLGSDGLLGLQPTITVADEIPDIEQLDLFISNEEEFYLWESVRCSAAAPTFLPAHIFQSQSGEYKGTCIDGAVVTNNPDQFALAYMTSAQDVEAEDVAILSLGQGILVKNLAKGRGLDRGITNWAVDLLTILTEGNTETQEIMMDTIFYQNLGVKAPQYLRIQYRNRENDDNEGLPALDDVEAIPRLVSIGQQLAELYDEYLDQFVARFLLGI
eukprot:TRINITY_DN1812_c0_g1_i10.p1 TRINITY_DN1812_c0_g1~~TRINITY_DN1812_c0_g1_i10.p1  ORF type:complete len:452 (-),score=52.10 TRINITY_DN1812_c0_g1_i10:201-1520(-)